MLTNEQKAHIVLSCLFRPGSASCLFQPGAVDYQLYAWKMHGTSDVKLIAAINDESAARIAVQTRLETGELSEKEALDCVLRRDYLAPVDPDVLFQGESPLWDGAEKLEGAVDKV